VETAKVVKVLCSDASFYLMHILFFVLQEKYDTPRMSSLLLSSGMSSFHDTIWCDFYTNAADVKDHVVDIVTLKYLNTLKN